MGSRNYWHVYNHMRRRLMEDGLQPERADLLAEFAELTQDEVDEGIEEFEVAMGRRRGGVASGEN